MQVETAQRRHGAFRSTRGRCVASIALVAVLVAAGCGGGGTKKAGDTSTTSTTAASSSTTTPGGGGSGDTGVCALVTPADIDAALHLTVGKGELFDNGSVTTCGFKTADGSTTINVTRYEPVGDLLKNTRAADPKAKDLPGVGDEAIDEIHIGSVTMRVGEIGLVIGAVPAPTLDGLVQLARIAAGRM